MATARIEEVLPEPPPKKVVLELSMREAEVLRGLTGRCAGPVEGTRGLTDAIYSALESAGVQSARMATDTIYLR